MRRPGPPVPDNGIYRLILWLMVVTVIFGAILAIASETLAQSPALSRLGTGIALVGGIIYAFFRWLGHREARRQENAAKDSPNANSGDTNLGP